MRHITGIPRQQLVLFPESLDEYISADNPVRFIDAFVDSLSLKLTPAAWRVFRSLWSARVWVSVSPHAKPGAA
jgi:hypothetical protein